MFPVPAYLKSKYKRCHALRDLRGDGLSGHLVVPRDHEDTDTGGAARLDRRLHLVRRRARRRVREAVAQEGGDPEGLARQRLDATLSVGVIAAEVLIVESSLRL